MIVRVNVSVYIHFYKYWIMSSERNLPVGRIRKQRYVIDPFGVTSSVMGPSRPQAYRNRLMCDYCGNQYEKHYVMKHLNGCMKKIESTKLKNHDIRDYICWLNIVISHVVILSTQNKCIHNPINMFVLFTFINCPCSGNGSLCHL